MMSLNRRDCLRAMLAMGLLSSRSWANDYPPVHRITNGPKFHWFGYYDKLQFDPTGRYVLGCEVDFEHRSPRPDDVIKIGMIDLRNGDKWIELGESRAWNWQQGCMLQFVPGSTTDIIWNDREGDGAQAKFVSHILNIETRQRRTVPGPIYALSPDGQTAIFPDFRRLNDCRPGYGYAGIADPNRDLKTPTDAGIWKMSLKTGQIQLIVPFSEISKLPYQQRSRPFHNDPQLAKHWFNHLLFNTDGTRFLWLHRWREFGDKDRNLVARGGFSTRMLTANLDGQDRSIVDPFGGTSHFVWRDPQHIAAWAWHPSLGRESFYLFKDKSTDVTPIGPDVMTVNGHNTYIAQRDSRWILNDTYPDKERKQRPYLFDTQTNAKHELGAFLSPKEYTGEWRCDTHPRSSPDGNWVVIDSTHEGVGRQMYLINIAKIVGPAKK